MTPSVNQLLVCQHPSGLIFHGSIVLVSLLLFVWWTKKKALISFRAWALFMVIVHTLYFFLICGPTKIQIGLTMNDVFFIRGIEILATISTLLRLYFIIEAHGIDITDNNNDIGPIKVITSSVRKAVVTPEDPKEINGNKKKVAKKTSNLRKQLLNWLF